MKNQIQLWATFIFIAFFFSSCDVVEGIFKAGMSFGIFIVIAIIALIIFIIAKISGKK